MYVLYSFWACLDVLGKIKRKRTVQHCYAVKEKVSFVAGKEVGLEGNAADCKWSCLVNRAQGRTEQLHADRVGVGRRSSVWGAVLNLLAPELFFKF